MSGAILQLIAYGAQDIYLTGNPMITFFKTVYRRHTNFSIESIEQMFNKQADFGTKVSTLISRDGDLITGVAIQATLPDLPLNASVDNNHYIRWTDDIGHHLLKSVNIEIGGQIIDQHYGDWLEIWAQLTVSANRMVGYREMIGQDPTGPLGMNTGLQRDRGAKFDVNPIRGRTIFIPLQFWFCRNIGLALPLIAIQYSDVVINIEFREKRELIAAFDVNGNGGETVRLDPFPVVGGLVNVGLWVDYVYLDTDERRRFAQISHEYLIEQLQFTSVDVQGDAVNERAVKIDLDMFNHSIKELIWVAQSKAATENGHVQWSNYTDRSALNFRNVDNKIMDLKNLGAIYTDIDTVTGNHLTTGSSLNIRASTSISYKRPHNSGNNVLNAKLLINGDTRFATQSGFYFNWIVPRKHHSNIPESPGINVYTFSIFPEQHQPSGSCNFSRINTASLVLTISTGFNHVQRASDNSITSMFQGSDTQVRVYAVNYNIFRVMNGMAGLAYSL